MYSFYTLLHTILFTSVSQVWVLQATCKELKTKNKCLNSNITC